MTPQELKIQELETSIANLQNEVNLLKATATIPFDVEMAFRKRLNIDSFTPTETSSKGATTENQSVNESGASSYSVLKAPDGFLQITLSGSVYYLPYFT
jgi:hypothetical protein